MSRFLLALEETGGQVKKACEMAGIDRTTIWDYRKSDPKFAAQYDIALDKGIDLLEAEAKRRAFEGVDEPVFYQGGKCGMIRRYSDTLLMFIIKGNRPRYKDKVELSGDNSSPLFPKQVTLYIPENQRKNASD